MLGAGKVYKSKDLYDKFDYAKREKVDFTEALKVQIPQNRDLALKQGNLSEAVENLLALEKQTRLATDLPATTEVSIAIVQLCFECKDWVALNNNVTLLVKRRGQLKQVVAKVVQEAFTYIEHTPDMETKLALIHALRAVSEGKIHTELERARLTRILAKLKEDEGKISEAAEILQEVQVETYGSMEREEKIGYILEQVRLCLDNKDYIRASILCKKINTKHFEDGKHSELKLAFYHLLNRLHFHNDAFLDLAKSFFAIYSTPIIKDDPAKWKEALRDVVIFAVLSPFSNEQSDLLARIALDKNLDEIPDWKNLVQFFRSQEITRWPLISETYLPLLSSHSAFSDENRDKRISTLHSRVIEHNIQIVSKYYTRVTMARLSSLLDLDLAATEKHLCALVSSKLITAKIDRPIGICTFAARKDPNDTLNEWAHNISDLLGKLEKTCHIINKERMLANAAK